MKEIQAFRQRKILLFYPYFLFFLAVVFVACKQELNMVSVEPESTPELLVKKWYESNIQTITESSIPEFKKIQPRWSTAIRVKKSIELAFDVDGRFPIPNNTKSKGLKNLGRQKLLFTPNGLGYDIKIIRYLPSELFKDDIKKINSENVLKSKFDGTITIQKITSKDIVIYRVSDGVIIRTTKGFSEQPANNSSNFSATTSQCWCSFEQCTSWYSCPGNNAMQAYNSGCCQFIQYECKVVWEPCAASNCETGEEPIDPTTQCPYLPWCDDHGNDNGNGTGSTGDSNSGCQCANGSVNEDGPFVFFIPIQQTDRAFINMKGDFNVQNCSVPLYTFSIEPEIKDHPTGTFEFEKRNYQVGTPIPIDANDLYCGHSVSQKVNGSVTWNTYDYGYFPPQPVNFQKTYSGFINAELK
jgi:hypothetical protein